MREVFKLFQGCRCCLLPPNGWVFLDCELPLYRSDIPKYSKGHDSMMHKAALRQAMHVLLHLRQIDLQIKKYHIFIIACDPSICNVL